MTKKNLMLLCVFIAAVWMAVPPEAFGQLFGRRVVQQRQQVQQRQSLSAGPQIHMLFVWGTKATDTHWATRISQTKIERAFNSRDEINLPRNSRHVGTYLTLEGNNAAPQNIINACERLARNAGPNDAVFVYILCHGASVYEDDDTERTARIHALSPMAETAENMDLRTIGIRRSTILHAMKSGSPHRFTMLVTDSCSVLRSEEELRQAKPYMSGAMESWRPPVLRSVLAHLLLTAEGTIDINSSHPEKGSMNQGELALAWVPSFRNVRNDRQFLRYATEDGSRMRPGVDNWGAVMHSGTVFTNAFLAVAAEQREFEASARASVAEFLGDLTRNLDRQYKDTRTHVQRSGGSGIELFMQQPTQTLTHFDEMGVALP